MKKIFTLFVCFMIISIHIPSFSQTQLGEDIPGEDIFDQSSFVSISGEGNRLIIGAPFQGPGFSGDKGHARIFEWNGDSWIKVGATIEGVASGDQCGKSVSISANGNRIAIASPFNNQAGISAGHVRVFEWDESDWVLVGAPIEGSAAYEIFGYSVSLSGDGNRIAITAHIDHMNSNEEPKARIYDWDGTEWVQVGSDIDIEGEAGSLSLSADGNRVAFGLNLKVYEWDGENWTQMGDDEDWNISNEQSLPHAWSVSLSADGNRIAFGEPFGTTGNQLVRGLTQVYEWNGANWMQLGLDIEGEEEGDASGNAVSLSANGNRVAIGAPGNDGNGEDAGHVRIFEWNGISWVKVGMDIDGKEAGDGFGGDNRSMVSLSADGSRVAIGSRINTAFTGYVQVFEILLSSAVTSFAEAGIEVFPNPTTGTVNLTGIEQGTISLLDNFGRILFQKEIAGPEIDINELPAGIYFMHISSGDHIATGKIIKI